MSELACQPDNFNREKKITDRAGSVISLFHIYIDSK